jgi:hypothetical protein
MDPVSLILIFLGIRAAKKQETKAPDHHKMHLFHSVKIKLVLNAKRGIMFF